ncbi:MAG: saccharopine dehydrogenase NADP-binding domain-containing protein [Gammaproteobacteria bacterium]|nr:saccharopine dehydrogenase NADP-binding domain-containing protein [Gammaproteobacteria bacterium]
MSRILILGAGYVAGPLVDVLHRRLDNEITLASQFLAEAQALAKGRERIAPAVLDVNNAHALGELVKAHDLVVSFVPYLFHMKVAEQCLAHGKHLVTASYEQPAMKALDAEVAARGLTFLNEIGLDPGIDHLSAMRIIDEAHAEGAKVESFVSWCGGLPAPDANDNPLGYKFSWAPRAVLLALLNEARFRRAGVDVALSRDELLPSTSPVQVGAELALEGYPNRNSLNYEAIYGIDGVKDLLRGTLRYRGFAAILHAAKHCGLLDVDADPSLEQGAEPLGWQALIARQLGMTSPLAATALPFSKPVQEAFAWLGLLDGGPVPQAGNRLDAFCELLKAKLQYREGERDMVVLHHKFVIRKTDGSVERKTSTLIAYGEAGGYTAMAKTVGIPAALAAQLILDGKIDRRGVILPVTQDVYEPLLDALAHEGISSDERSFAGDDPAFLAELRSQR